MDVLGDVLALARVDAALMATVDARAPWGLELPARAGAAFHAVVAGTCWLSVDGGPPRQLMPGDVVLLPTGVRHELTAEPGLAVRRFDEALKRELITDDGELVLLGPGGRTRILCAGYTYDREVALPLLELLPPVLHVASAQPAAGPWLRGIVDLLAYEARGPAGAGATTASTRLLDVLLVHVVRAWLAGTADEPRTAHEPGTAHEPVSAKTPSWLRGLRDPLTARALAALHERPGEDWTLARLAAAVHSSRATLVRRFTQHVGEPPLSYLTRWRVEVAARRLRDTEVPVGVIAREVGYTSEFAFNRAFSRIRGCPPGRYRRAASRTS